MTDASHDVSPIDLHDLEKQLSYEITNDGSMDVVVRDMRALLRIARAVKAWGEARAYPIERLKEALQAEKAVARIADELARTNVTGVSK
jgi:hypothetical protein